MRVDTDPSDLAKRLLAERGRLIHERDAAMLEVIRLRSAIGEVRAALLDWRHPLNGDPEFQNRGPREAWIGAIDRVLGEKAVLPVRH